MTIAHVDTPFHCMHAEFFIVYTDEQHPFVTNEVEELSTLTKDTTCHIKFDITVQYLHDN